MRRTAGERTEQNNAFRIVGLRSKLAICSASSGGYKGRTAVGASWRIRCDSVPESVGSVGCPEAGVVSGIEV